MILRKVSCLAAAVYSKTTAPARRRGKTDVPNPKKREALLSRPTDSLAQLIIEVNSPGGFCLHCSSGQKISVTRDNLILEYYFNIT